MSDVYDVIKKAKENKDENWIPKEEYAGHMKERREELNQMVDKTLEEIKTDPKAYLNYLDKQANFDHYTVTNTLHIITQKPEATMIKSSDKWRDDKTYIRKGEKGFVILEPKDDYQREDGTIGKNYSFKTMFDISQLAKEPVLPEKKKLTVEELVGAICYRSSVAVELTDSNPNGQNVMYSMEDNKIYAVKGLTPQQLLTGLATEYCYAEIDPHQQNYTREDLTFSAKSSAYMLCKKYGIETPSTEFANDVSSYLGDLKNNEVKSFLSGFKETFDDVSKRMENGLYAQSLNREKEHNEVSR